MSPQLGDIMTLTYRTLRRGTAALGLALPWLLWAGGALRFGLPLQGSMSAYYHTPMRDVFVGVLFAVSGLLVVYRGYTWLENWALDLAGIFLCGVALFPMQAPGAAPGSAFSLHGTLAVLFFLCIAYVCLFRASDTLGLLHDEARERRYRRAYRWLGGLMIASPLIAAVLAFLLEEGAVAGFVVFFAEAVGVYVFAVYWTVKSRELEATGAEALAGRGRLKAPPHGARDLFRPLPVEQTE